MVEPISMLLMFLMGLGGVAAIAIAFLTIASVANYIRERRAQKSIREDAVLIKRKLASGKYRVVAGFLDGDDIKEAQAWEAEDVDSRIKGMDDDEVIRVPS